MANSKSAGSAGLKNDSLGEPIASSLPASTFTPINSDFEKDTDGWSGTNIHKQPERISLLGGGATTGSNGYLSLSQDKGKRERRIKTARQSFVEFKSKIGMN